MTDTSPDLDARLRAFFAAASPPPGLEDRVIARLRRRRWAFLAGRSPRAGAAAVDHPLSVPSGRAARLGAVTAALATAVALAAVGVASHHTLIRSGGAGTAAPAQQMTATASPADLSGARAATAAFFDPSLPQCWKQPAVQGAWPADSYARCPLTARLANQLRGHEGLYLNWSFLTEARTPSLPSGVLVAACAGTCRTGAVTRHRDSGRSHRHGDRGDREGARAGTVGRVRGRRCPGSHICGMAHRRHPDLRSEHAMGCSASRLDVLHAGSQWVRGVPLQPVHDLVGVGAALQGLLTPVG